MFVGSFGSGRVECAAVGPESKPRRIGRYEIRRELGRGMMGVVYEAWDPVLGRKVALKTVKAVAPSSSEREAWEQRFLSEARAAARLSHPCIVVVHDVGRDPESDVLFMALEYLHGETLAEKLASGRPLPWREALRIVGRVADALHHAHAQGVVHRDVKPANVMILASGEPKILDFGIARIDAGSLTLPGDLFGTPLYMSPEQAAGEAVDARSDLFSLGTITWALLTGRTPFEAQSVPAILSRVMLRDPPPPSELVPGIPADVDRILTRSTAKLPEERYPDGRSLAEDIDDVLAGRAPRHLVDWTPARTGERTISSQRIRADLVLAELEERQKEEDRAAPTAPPKPRSRRWRLRAMLMLALLACAGAFLFLHPEHVTILAALARQARDSRLAAAAMRFLASAPSPAPETSPSPAAAIPSLAPTPSTSETPAPGLGGDTAAAPAGSEAAGAAGESAPAAPETTGSETPQTRGPAEAPVASASPTPLATPPTAPAAVAKGTPPPAPSPSTTPTQPVSSAPPPKTSPKVRATAYLSIGFEHRLKSGILEIWVDDTRVVRETLDSRAAVKLLLFEVRKGSVQQTLPLEPGRHNVRVRIRSSGWTKAAESSILFRSGRTHRLEIKSLRLSGKISLVWK
jgi:serine/threonine-protein kinase